MDYTIPPHKLEEMKAFLRDHPVDPAWDEEAEVLDGDLPEDEYLARLCDFILKEQEKREAENR